MINKLKKRLMLLFFCSVMGIFTLVFFLCINENLQSAKDKEMNFFGRMATYLVLQLENSSNLDYDLDAAEQYYHFSLHLTGQNNSIIYPNSSASRNDISALIKAYERQRKHVLSEFSSNTSDTQSTLSGILTFSTPDHRSFYGIDAEIITQDTTHMKLYIMKDATDSLTLLKEHLSFYITIWIIVFFIILVLTKYLIDKAMQPTENSMQIQKEFIAAASHELKAPLAVILASAECISGDTNLSSEAKQHTAIIDSECMRMSKLVQDLLLLSSVDANTWPLKKTNIDVDTLLINTYEKYEPICRQKGILFELSTSDELFPVLNADIDRLDQILSIFIDNAINYSFPKSEISLDATVGKNMLVFTIKDHGTGIADKDKPFIFDRFFCADKSRTQKEHYGLGLCITKELVEMHRGKIELSDTVGGGCTFKVFFPL